MPQLPDVELIDVVDASGNPLAVAVPRAEVHLKGLWHRTVHIWVVNGANELLLQKRSAAKESFPGLWDISAAGHMAAGDTSRGAAARELREELGITAAEDDLTFLFTLRGHYEDPSRQFYDHELSDVYLMKTGRTVDSMRIDPDEVDEVKFMAVDALKGELERRPELYVPHHEAYEKLFGVLRGRF
jgi:isopentenyl-diphosphate delta-isomerase type 1